VYLNEWHSAVLTRGECESYAGSLYFGHLGAALFLWAEIDTLVKRFAVLHGIDVGTPLDRLRAELLPDDWVFVDMPYGKVVDNYLTYLERVITDVVGEKEARRLTGGSIDKIDQKIESCFGFSLAPVDGRLGQIRHFCALRNILTHKRAKVDQRYHDSASGPAYDRQVGTEVLIDYLHVMQAAHELSDSVRHIECELIARFPNLSLAG